MARETCAEILEKAYRSAEGRKKSFLANLELAGRVANVALCPQTRAGARFLIAATLAKVEKPMIDIRKPFIQAYAEAEKANAYAGHGYDEQHVFDHLFHRRRTEHLDAYQELVLAQAESAVNQALKEAFLALRKAAQAAV